MAATGLSGGSALDEELKTSNVVRLRGLPFSATEKDIESFFKPLEAGPDGVVICMNFHGKSTGQAYMQFADAEQANQALEKNRQHMGTRYIEVFKGHPSDMQNALKMAGKGGASITNLNGAGHVPGAMGNADMRYTGVIRMRGMPYSSSPADVVAFFKGQQVAQDGVLICTHQDGRATGEAYVEFVSDEAATEAMALDRERMGSRYVELFRSTKGEMVAAVQQRMYGGMMMGNPGMLGQSVPAAAMMGGFQMQQMQQMAAMQAQMGLGMGIHPAAADGSENTVVKLRGLPFAAGQREIMEFFEGYQIAQNGLHICVGPMEKPTGEAYVEFVSIEEAARAMERHRQNIGSRYIELFRATKSEMLMAVATQGGASSALAASFGLQAMDPSVQLLLMQQQQAALQHQGLGGYGMGGLMPQQSANPWGVGVADVAQATAAAQAAAANFYRQQAAGGGGMHGNGL